MKALICIIFYLFSFWASAQKGCIRGEIRGGTEKVPYAQITVSENGKFTLSDSEGRFEFLKLEEGNYTIIIHAMGYLDQQIMMRTQDINAEYQVIQVIVSNHLQDVLVVSGTLKPVSKSDSPIPIEVYTSSFFNRNKTSNLFDGLQNINGVRPQINCNICNTGDIHINGLEGPYTMVLIDGMPVVSGLATVYGLSGIPQSLIDRIEIIKGPASTLYGSEAIGGVINVITKNPNQVSTIHLSSNLNSWLENNNDLAISSRIGKRTKILIGINYFNYQNPVDKNHDNFTDLTLQRKISVFNSLRVQLKRKQIVSISGRYIQENRWGGEMQWKPIHAGGDSIYGESITTNRWETLGSFPLFLKENIKLQWSVCGHKQKSYYGNKAFDAYQLVGFSQIVWNRRIKTHDIVFGATYRYQWYDDNTPATMQVHANGSRENLPSLIHLPGIFIQDEKKINSRNSLLMGIRFDKSSLHGKIISPRVNYLYRSNFKKNTVRIGIGNGYRVVNIFTEDHAALTGSRTVVFNGLIKPETSWNGNLNFVKTLITKKDHFLQCDLTAFYTYFINRIIVDYNSNPNLIIYKNVNGYSISRGISAQLDMTLNNGFSAIFGCTTMDIYSIEDDKKIRPFFTEKTNFTWSLQYLIPKLNLALNYTGNAYSPMQLPLQSSLDPRKPYSPWWSTQNIQATFDINQRSELTVGIKNILDWTPNKGNPFIIARSHDPFDKNVQFNDQGYAIANAQNPYGLTFDASYVYGPNQGRRIFIEFNYNID